MRFQFIQIWIFGQVEAEVFGTREGIQISEYGIALYFARVLHAQVVGVGVHAADLLFHFLGSVGKVDAVAQRLAHFCFTVGSRQTQASGIVGQQDFGFNKRLTIYIIEAANDFASLFNHRFLVFAYGNGCGFESCDICCLADGVCKETYRNACLKVAHLNFSLYGRVTL